MYDITNSVKLFDDELKGWLLESGFIRFQCQISIYYKDATEGTKNIVLSYVYGYIYWYTSEALGKWFVDTLVDKYEINHTGNGKNGLSNKNGCTYGIYI